MLHLAVRVRKNDTREPEFFTDMFIVRTKRERLHGILPTKSETVHARATLKTRTSTVVAITRKHDQPAPLNDRQGRGITSLRPASFSNRKSTNAWPATRGHRACRHSVPQRPPQTFAGQSYSYTEDPMTIGRLHTTRPSVGIMVGPKVPTFATLFVLLIQAVNCLETSHFCIYLELRSRRYNHMAFLVKLAGSSLT